MRIISFILGRSPVERILARIGEAVEALEVLPARGQPQAEMEFGQVDQAVSDGGDT